MAKVLCNLKTILLIFVYEIEVLVQNTMLALLVSIQNNITFVKIASKIVYRYVDSV